MRLDDWVAVLALALLGVVACARGPMPQTHDLAWQLPPAVSSSTVALWRFDETTGLDFSDSGPDHRDGVFGIDTRAAFGRFLNARQFTPSINSFALVPANHAPRLTLPWTVEAWINPAEFGSYEDTPIVSRWPQGGLQSWLFSIVGGNRFNPLSPGPGDHTDLGEGERPNRTLRVARYRQRGIRWDAGVERRRNQPLRRFFDNFQTQVQHLRTWQFPHLGIEARQQGGALGRGLHILFS